MLLYKKDTRNLKALIPQLSWKQQGSTRCFKLQSASREGAASSRVSDAPLFLQRLFKGLTDRSRGRGSETGDGKTWTCMTPIVLFGITYVKWYEYLAKISRGFTFTWS